MCADIKPCRFNPDRWIPDKETGVAEALSPAAKLAFHPFGAGARSCIGIHLARMELRYACAFFFRECQGIRLGERTTPESMEFEVCFFFLLLVHFFFFLFCKGGEVWANKSD